VTLSCDKHLGLNTVLKHNHKIIGPHIPTHFPTNINRQPDVLDIAFIKTSALPIYTESVEALRSYHNPVILVMHWEPHEAALPRMDPFRVRRVYSRELLK
jgi:hypothetical protein